MHKWQTSRKPPTRPSISASVLRSGDASDKMVLGAGRRGPGEMGADLEKAAAVVRWVLARGEGLGMSTKAVGEGGRSKTLSSPWLEERRMRERFTGIVAGLGLGFWKKTKRGFRV